MAHGAILAGALAAEIPLPPILTDMDALSLPLCGAVSTRMDANRAGRVRKGKAEAEVVALFSSNNARRPFALFPGCHGLSARLSLPMLRRKTQRSEYMEQTINSLARIFEEVLDAYEATGRVPDQLISQAQHEIIMARLPA